MRRLTCSTGHGYVEVACARRRSSSPTAATARSISSVVDIPVESMSGFDVERIRRKSGRSVSDADAAL